VVEDGGNYAFAGMGGIEEATVLRQELP